MISIMQRIRDCVFNHTFIILQRHREQNRSHSESVLHDESSIANSKNCPDDSVTDNLKNSSIKIGPSNSVDNDKDQKNRTQAICGSKNDSEGHSSKKGKSTVKSPESKEFEVYLSSLYANLKSNNSLEARCSSVLKLAVCLVDDSPDVDLSDCFEALKDLCDSTDFPHLAVCHALLLCSLTKMSMSMADLFQLEESIVNLTNSLKRKNIYKMSAMYKVGALLDEHEESTLKLCKEVFKEDYLDFKDIDISTICCCTLYNLSSLVQQFDDDLGEAFNFKDMTLKYILGITGRATQEITPADFSMGHRFSGPNMTLHRLTRCLQVLEHALSINPDLTYRHALHSECSLLPHCLTRLLGWSVSSVFPVKDQKPKEENSNYFTFHHSTLVCILKILSILTFNPDQYDSFSNVKGLMEKILLCTLKAYFESEENHFDIQILCLEMLINLYIKNQKTFIVLCLKRFRISNTEEVLAVEALLKMLSDNLGKIKEVKEQYPKSDKNEVSGDVLKESNKVTKENQDNHMHEKLKETMCDASDDDLIKKPRKEVVDGALNDDSLKKIRKEIAGDVSKDDSVKKPRKEIAEDVSKYDSIKKPRKEIAKDVSNNDCVEKLQKDITEVVSNDDSGKKSSKETTEGVLSDDSVERARKETVKIASNENFTEESKEAVLEASNENITDESENVKAESKCDQTPKEKPKATTAETEAVLQAASRDMEHSTIVSFICVLIVFFMRTKQNFKEFILQRLTSEDLKEATIVSQKFLEFASLTGGMPVTGILILTQTINKLQSLQS